MSEQAFCFLKNLEEKKKISPIFLFENIEVRNFELF